MRGGSSEDLCERLIANLMALITCVKKTSGDIAECNKYDPTFTWCITCNEGFSGQFCQYDGSSNDGGSGGGVNSDMLQCDSYTGCMVDEPKGCSDGVWC